jgi:hypothetical protein
VDKLTNARIITALKLHLRAALLGEARHKHSNCRTDQLTNSLQPSSSWKANGSSACQEISHILCTAKVKFTTGLLPSHPTPHHPTLISLSNIGFNNIFSSKPRSSQYHSSFTTKNLWRSLFCPIRATWPAHLILLDLITRRVKITQLLITPLYPPSCHPLPRHPVLEHPRLMFFP